MATEICTRLPLWSRWWWLCGHWMPFSIFVDRWLRLQLSIRCSLPARFKQLKHTWSVAYDLERETTPHSCHGVCTDRYIFSLNFPQKLKLSDQSQARTSFYWRHNLTGSKKKYKMAESCEEYSDGCSVDSYEDFESPSPSSSSEESANEDEPDASSISGPSG